MSPGPLDERSLGYRLRREFLDGGRQPKPHSHLSVVVATNPETRVSGANGRRIETELVETEKVSLGPLSGS